MARKRLACLNLWKLFMYTNYPSWPKSSVNVSYFLRSSWFTVGLVVASDRHISPYRDKSILIMAATSWSFKGDEYVGCDNIIQNRGCFMAEFCFYLHRITTFEIYFSGSSPVQNSELYKNWNDNSSCVFEAKNGGNWSPSCIPIHVLRSPEIYWIQYEKSASFHVESVDYFFKSSFTVALRN